MKIVDMRINHLENPIGFQLNNPYLSYRIEAEKGTCQTWNKIRLATDEKMQNIVFEAENQSETIGIQIPVKLNSRTRYYWNVEARSDAGDSAKSETAFFETAWVHEPIRGRFIRSEKTGISCIFKKKFNVKYPLKEARLYVSGLGFYEVYVNGEKIGDEFLTPYFNDYDSWIQYQTFDITHQIQQSDNEIEIWTGDGLFIGNFGFDGGKDCIYGEHQMVWCDLVLCDMENVEEHVVTDTSWKVCESPIRYSSIYHGEVYDATYVSDGQYEVIEENQQYNERLEARRSLPVNCQETISPIQIIQTPRGETVIDMGQNMVGWLVFKCRQAKGERIHFQFGEILQEGNFYRENLREAKAEFTYISDGNEQWVRPHFTFYGFRYVKVTGLEQPISLDDFQGWCLYSDMEKTGSIETSHPLVNQLISNIEWGHKDNFLDIPTDCPQRDERMGWTGDAQVFAGTAAFQMDVYAFFSKYCYDLSKEQKKYNGNVPMVIPSVGMGAGGSSVWADAATIIPWTMYLFYGDQQILSQQYESMKAWVDYIHLQVENSDSEFLWSTGFHFGDWLALDGTGIGLPTGATDITYIASAYYYYSSLIVAKSAKVLEKEVDAVAYSKQAKQIKEAIIEEYYTPSGRLSIDTQTGYALALFLDLIPCGKQSRVAKDLAKRIEKDGESITTGFVGTPFLCQVLSDNGYNDLAYTLLLNENAPSWLYPVKMGATTIWERWDSVLEDGNMNPAGMNSLNHYAYGSIAEWMYRTLLGFNPIEEEPGFKTIRFAPKPNERLTWVKGSLKTIYGTYQVSWEIKDRQVNMNISIPFGAKAYLDFKEVAQKNIEMNNVSYDVHAIEQKTLKSGNYSLRFMLK